MVWNGLERTVRYFLHIVQRVPPSFLWSQEDSSTLEVVEEKFRMHSEIDSCPD